MLAIHNTQGLGDSECDFWEQREAAERLGDMRHTGSLQV